jgi:hypothetical protein
MVRLGALLRRKDKDEKPEEAPASPVVEGPPLMVLIPDVAGVSSFRAHSFPDSEAASRFVTSLSRQQRERAHAFWALQHEPAGASDGEDTTGEATVLIRAEEGSDLVYVVSFVDIESAQSFARFEVKRGMHLGLMLVYWASMVNVVLAEDRVQLIPEFPPRIEKRIQPNGRKPALTKPAATDHEGSQEPPHEIQPEELDRLKEEAEEHRRIAAEAEELRQLLAEAEQKQRAAAEAEEQRRLEAEAEDRRLAAEAEEERLAAEAERRRLATEAEEQRLAAEAEEQRRLAAEAEEHRLAAEAEEQRLAAEAEEQRLAAEAEEQRLAAEAEEQRLAAEEERRRLAAEVELQRLAAEAEERRLAAEEERRLAAEAEEQHRPEREAEEQRRLEEQAEEWRLQAEVEEEQRDEADENASLAAEAEERIRIAAEKQHSRELAAEAELQRLRESMEREQARVEDESPDEHLPDNALGLPSAPEPEEALAASQAFEQSDIISDGAPEAQEIDSPNPIEELLRAESETRVHIPSQYALERPPETAEDEDDPTIADEVSKILRRRRWEKRESPFEGFNSPPGRF